MEIGIKLKELRLKNQLTQEELADRSELTKGYISQLENDLTSPSIATLKDILQALGSSLSEFFSEDEEEPLVFTKEDYFLKEGEKAVSISKGDIWVNPTNQVAKPLIKITGSSGTFTIGDRTVTLNAINEYIMLDSELEHAYKGLTNCNANISALYFPVLNTGANTITWTGNITAVEIIPRWWTL